MSAPFSTAASIVRYPMTRGLHNQPVPFLPTLLHAVVCPQWIGKSLQWHTNVFRSVRTSLRRSFAGSWGS
jgi:hypothetical protein